MPSESNAFGELINEFVAECLPLAEEAADGLLELERRWAAGDRCADLVKRLKGLIHTVKGNSAMMGLDRAAEVAHALEDELALAVDDPAARAEGPDWDALMDGAAELIELVRGAEQDGQDGRGGPDGPGGHGANTVRVDFRRMDALQELVGEAMITQSGLREVQRRLVARIGRGAETADFDAAIVALEKTNQRLEDAIMAARLVPLSGMFGRFNRLIREVAQSVGKRVRLEATGGDTRLDKAVVDRLGEPLVHLLTNAIVHGIEPEAERASAGKAPEGAVRFAASTAGDRVVITLSDDGRGLDAARITERARELGLEIGSGSANEIYPLIFAGGLSTATSVTQLAGRGVGLDIVAAALHAMGGTIEVQSEPGRGTGFTIRLPLTLAVVRTLLVEVARERYAIPLAHVAEATAIERDQIHEVNRKGVVLWRGEVLPVVDGAVLVGSPGSGVEREAVSASGRRYNVVVHAGSKRRGVLVDRLVGHQTVVAKGMDPALGRGRLVSGTTITGDGRVTCILDAQRMVEGGRMDHRKARTA